MKTTRCFVLLFFFISVGSMAQIRENGKWSIEASAGIHIPFSPADFVNTNDYIAFKQYQLSLRYMFNDTWGLKGHYGRNRFEDKNDHSLGTTYNRIALEGVLDLGSAMNILQRSEIHLLGHFGGGLTFVPYEDSEDPYDNIGNLMIGFTGLRQVSRGVDVLADITFVKGFEVQHAYSGEVIDKGSLPLDGYGGFFMNISIGLVIYLNPR